MQLRLANSTEDLFQCFGRNRRQRAGGKAEGRGQEAEGKAEGRGREKRQRAEGRRQKER